MKVYQIDCSNCGASLDIEEGRTKGFCQYCGTPYVVSNETTKSNNEENKPLTPEKEIQLVIKAERSGDYEKVVMLYNSMLAKAPERPDLLIGRAFAMITESKENLYNLDAFKNAFVYAVDKAKIWDAINVHTIVLDKLWSIKQFLLRSLLKMGSRNPSYITDLVALNNLQMYINDFATSTTFDNPTKGYITNYKNLKEDIKFFGERILLQAKMSKDAVSKQYLKYVEQNVKDAERVISELNRKYY